MLARDRRDLVTICLIALLSCSVALPSQYARTELTKTQQVVTIDASAHRIVNLEHLIDSTNNQVAQFWIQRTNKKITDLLHAVADKSTEDFQRVEQELDTITVHKIDEHGTKWYSMRIENTSLFLFVLHGKHMHELVAKIMLDNKAMIDVLIADVTKQIRAFSLYKKAYVRHYTTDQGWLPKQNQQPASNITDQEITHWFTKRIGALLHAYMTCKYFREADCRGTGEMFAPETALRAYKPDFDTAATTKDGDFHDGFISNLSKEDLQEAEDRKNRPDSTPVRFFSRPIVLWSIALGAVGFWYIIIKKLPEWLN